MICTFSIIDEVASLNEITYGGNRIMIRKKEVEDIHVFKDDFKSIKAKYFTFISDHSRKELELTFEENELLEKAFHAAYYFLTESKKEKSPVELKFIDSYKQYYKK